MTHEAPGMIELSDKPGIFLLADSEAGAARARRSAELAGCRVSGSGTLEDALPQLERPAAAGAVFVELEHDHAKLLDTLLDRLEERAAISARSSVVSAPIELIDAVVARTANPLVQHLCGADELQRVAAIAFACAPRKRMLHDVGREQGLPELEDISRDVARLAAVLATLAEREGRTKRLLPHISSPAGAPAQIDAGAVRALIRARRLRDQYFGPDLFADPAWDILLDLYAAQLEKQRVAVSSLCIAAAVPATTALRWIKTLTDMGVLLRSADPQDGRRVYIELAPKSSEALEAYLGAAQRISPLIL